MQRVLTLAFLALGCTSLAGAQQFKPEQIYRHPRLQVPVADFPAGGLILDIGGGGEGIIAQVKGRQVVAIDLMKRELEELPPASNPLLKIVMDARDLKFLDSSFDTATVFFTFMYIDPADHAKVFQEIHRVLKPGGRLLIWDPVFPDKRTDPGHVVFRELDCQAVSFQQIHPACTGALELLHVALGRRRVAFHSGSVALTHSVDFARQRNDYLIALGRLARRTHAGPFRPRLDRGGEGEDPVRICTTGSCPNSGDME